jgi:hypothetical protein
MLTRFRLSAHQTEGAAAGKTLHQIPSEASMCEVNEARLHRNPAITNKIQSIPYAHLQQK